MKISCVILTKNEEKNIGKCLDSVKWCDEIIIVDDYSTDKTPSIVRDLNLKLFQRHLNGDFAGQRNFGLSKASEDWVLFLDADEVISPSLRDEIFNLKFPSDNFEGFYIKRRDILWGKELKHGETGTARLLRLGKKKAGLWNRKVHEYWSVKGKLGELENPILHHPHQSIREFVSDINFYSSLHAGENRSEKKNSSLFKIIVLSKAKFIYNMIILLGFLDGMRGFVLTLLMSFHSFLAWSKLFLKDRK